MHDMSLKFEYTVHKYHLQVTQYTDNYSHPTSRELYAWYPKNRLPTDDEYQMILKLMDASGCDSATNQASNQRKFNIGQMHNKQ
jgi:hypothetical protein